MPAPTLARWALVGLLSLLLASTVGAVTTRAERERRRWGTQVPVLVTARAVDNGSPLRGAVRVTHFPEALVPADAFSSEDDLPAGATASGGRSAGEPVTRAGISTATASGPPRVAVPTPGPRPRLSIGDHVSIWATYDPSLAGTKPATTRIAAGATVVAIGDDDVVVAVSDESVGEVVEAAALATVTVVSERR
ncbi:MAG: hypothetical protein KDB02_10805 [Acidimicrobiales bacterium]|nr:hypothetical protein [Acidimicrobiales bacterium]